MRRLRLAPLPPHLSRVSPRRDNPHRTPRSLPAAHPAAHPPSQCLRLPHRAAIPASAFEAGEQQRVVILKGTEELVDSAGKVQENGVGISGIVIEDLPILENPEFRQKTSSPARPAGIAATVANGGDHDQQLVSRSRLPLRRYSVPGQPGHHKLGRCSWWLPNPMPERFWRMGTKWFSTPLLTGQVRLAPGDRISLAKLQADKDWLNQNPFRQVDIVAQKGASPGTTDFTVEIRRQKTSRCSFTPGYNNSGVPIHGTGPMVLWRGLGKRPVARPQFSYTFTSNKPLWGLGEFQPDDVSSNILGGTMCSPAAMARQAGIFFGAYARATPDLGPDLGLTGINRPTECALCADTCRRPAP